MLWDTHIHTWYSGDSAADPEAVVTSAVEKGLAGICVTDHLDLDFPETEGFTPLDAPAYDAGIRALQARYHDTFPICFGVEMGLQPHLAETHRDFLSEHDFDFVIGSSHAVHGQDPYFAPFYEGRSDADAYREYFTSIVENIRAYDDFDVYGHIDYVVRYGPTKNQDYSYAAYRDVIDEILTLLVERGKGIELNTAGFRYGLGHPNPTEDILRRYRELGGEIITVGSDAHRPRDVAFAFEKVPDILKQCGFDYYTVFRERKPEFVRI